MAKLKVLKRPAASRDAVGSTNDAPVLDRIAAALERIAEAQTPRPEAEVVLPAADLEVPAALRPLLAVLDAAGAGGSADAALTALGCRPGHPRRGMAFAVLQGLRATVRPEVRLRGLDDKRRTSEPARLRVRNFVEKRHSICLVAVFAGVEVATVIQGLARELLHSERLRRVHGQRFLDQVAECWDAAGRLRAGPSAA